MSDARPSGGREIRRHECLACGGPIERFMVPKSRGMVEVIGCRKGCAYVVDIEGCRRPYEEVCRLVIYREVASEVAKRVGYAD